jgi:hypothetical protein
MMWPFSRKKEDPKPSTPPFQGYDEVACEFFQMDKEEQLQFLFYLGVPDEGVALASSQPARRVELLLEITELPEKTMSAGNFLMKLKELIDMGRRHTVVAVLQNLFPTVREAERYTDVVAKWE